MKLRCDKVWKRGGGGSLLHVAPRPVVGEGETQDPERLQEAPRPPESFPIWLRNAPKWSQETSFFSNWIFPIVYLCSGPSICLHIRKDSTKLSRSHQEAPEESSRGSQKAPWRCFGGSWRSTKLPKPRSSIHSSVSEPPRTLPEVPKSRSIGLVDVLELPEGARASYKYA